MKKVFSLCLICLLAVSVMAQRAAVMEFKAGVGISQADVDGLSGIFTTYFRPAGYTMVERTQIDQIIDEQQMQRSTMTESQMVRVGELLNLSKIVIGDVNIILGQYNVDVRVINVESGTISATEGATLSGVSYREGIKTLAQKLASQISISVGANISSSSSSSSTTNQIEAHILYGYLAVFPTDLGTFETFPKQVVTRLNQSQQYGYGTWRLPTNEELALLRANNLVGADETYMTEENQKGIVRLVTDKEKGDTIALPKGYVDLGLPSGTLWKDVNENYKWTYSDAIDRFGNQLPTKEQYEELIKHCQWNRLDDSDYYTIVGPNGNTIRLDHWHGARSCYGDFFGLEKNGYYWTSTRDTDGDVYRLTCGAFGYDLGTSDTCFEYSVRLVLSN